MGAGGSDILVAHDAEPVWREHQVERGHGPQEGLMDGDEVGTRAQRLGLGHGGEFGGEVAPDELGHHPPLGLVEPRHDLLKEGRFALHGVESVGQVSAQLLVIGYQSRFHIILISITKIQQRIGSLKDNKKPP